MNLENYLLFFSQLSIFFVRHLPVFGRIIFVFYLKRQDRLKEMCHRRGLFTINLPYLPLLKVKDHFSGYSHLDLDKNYHFRED